MPDGEALGTIETYHAVGYSDWWDFTDEDTGDALDVSGWSASLHVRSGTPDQPGAVVVEVSTDNGKLTTPAAGRLLLTLTAEDLGPTEGLEPGDYYAELLVGTTGGDPDDIVERYWWTHRPTGVGADLAE